MNPHETSENICCEACETPVEAVDMGRSRPLATMAVNESGRVCAISIEGSDASLLRAMGLRPRSVVRVRRTGEPCIIEVLTGVKGDGGGCAAEGGCWCRIGLAKVLAQQILVAGAS